MTDREQLVRETMRETLNAQRAEIKRLREALFLISSKLTAQDMDRDRHVVEFVRETLANRGPL